MPLQTEEQKAWRALAWVAAAPLVVTGILAGCSAQRRTPPAAGPAPAPSLGSAPTLGGDRGFFLNKDRDTASLSYGKANSDDVQLMLQCERGSREVQIVDVAHDDQAKGAAILTLISGAASSDVKARVAPDETGQTLASAHAPTALPAFAAFRHTGALSVKLRGKSYALKATPGELASVARFFGACEKR